MTKQEFLAMSLPYDVKAIDKFEGIWTIHAYKDALYSLRDNEHLSYENFIKEEGHRLILRPLSDLTKPIEHKRETFIPIVKIAEILGYENISLKGNDCQVGLIESGSSYIKETLRYTDNYFYIDVEDYYYSSDSVKRYKDGIFIDHFQLFQKLIEWHFDIADLLSKGEAIDVNTLEENPYK